jgi:hypothetical protein
VAWRGVTRRVVLAPDLRSAPGEHFDLHGLPAGRRLPRRGRGRGFASMGPRRGRRGRSASTSPEVFGVDRTRGSVTRGEPATRRPGLSHPQIAQSASEMRNVPLEPCLRNVPLEPCEECPPRALVDTSMGRVPPVRWDERHVLAPVGCPEVGRELRPSLQRVTSSQCDRLRHACGQAGRSRLGDLRRPRSQT